MLDVKPPSGRSYGRSMVVSRQGICATSQPLASEAGARILREGGSAVDAAIAANAVLGVVEPMMNGIGGDLFAIYWEAKTGKLTGINASGPAPRALSPEGLGRLGFAAMPEAGIHAVTVPGAVDGWAKMHARFGKLPWRRLLAPAVAYAEAGFPVSEVVAALWSAPAALAKLDANPESARVFLPEGEAPREGDVFRNPGLAIAYYLLAEKGPDAFYRGEIAASMVKTSQARGGAMTAEDLALYAAEFVEPISVDYRGWRVYELPPNGQGLAVLQMLNIMESLPAAEGGPCCATELHKRIEAMKLAYADAWRYNCDPLTGKIPLDGLLAKDYGKLRARAIHPVRANAETGPGIPMSFPTRGSDTVYLAVVDREGNIASWIQSIYAGFGSGIVAEGMGFALQNRGAGFTLEAEHPNVLAGGKRPYHTIIPGFMERGGEHVGFGIMGGVNQPMAHAQFVGNVVDYGMTLQQALETPRFFRSGPLGCDVSIEARVAGAVMEELRRMGHEVTVRPEYAREMGRGQAVMHRDETRVNFGASDPRSDGAAMPEGIAF